ncbi:MAG TPA: hypothetical protein VJ692_05475 [Nitrospiraceae bacterium]|nr:hypothetical protein [Nitrospiraceae bacterium]
MNIRILILTGLLLTIGWHPAAWGQSASGVRAFGGGVGVLFGLVGPGNLYLDHQGTQGYMYTPGNNFESYNFRNPMTGQAWSGAVMTLGPQLTVGIIQGANQVGSPVVLVPPPPSVIPSLVSPFSLNRVNPLVTPVLDVTQTTAPLVGGSQLLSGAPRAGGVPSILLGPPRQPPTPLDIESSLIEIP